MPAGFQEILGRPGFNRYTASQYPYVHTADH